MEGPPAPPDHLIRIDTDRGNRFRIIPVCPSFRDHFRFASFSRLIALSSSTRALVIVDNGEVKIRGRTGQDKGR
jgi:hypothetical protein